MASSSTSSDDLTRIASQGEILSLLECPICLELPLPPIYTCVRGHNICNSCKSKLTECPTCKGKLTDARNFTAEKIILSSKYKCRNRESGCLVEVTGELMKAHLVVCPFRSISCPMGMKDSCQHKLSLRLSDAKKHLIEFHKCIPGFASSQTIVKKFSSQRFSRIATSNAIWRLKIIEFDEASFVFQTFNMKENICFTVSHIGPEETSLKYYAKVTLQREAESKLEWTIPIVSIITTEEQKMRRAVFAASCNMEVFNQFVDKNNKDVYEFDIRVEIVRN